VAGYDTVITGDKSPYTVTNTHTTATTEAKVVKIWDDKQNQDGKRPAELKVTLSDGTEVTLSESNNWTATVKGLPKYKDHGTDIIYSWKEGLLPEGYELTDTSVNGTETTLTNSYEPETMSVSVQKVWEDNNNQDGIRPSELIVKLSDGKEVTLNEGNGWKATVSGLPVYNAGNTITYSWAEETVPDGYELTGNEASGTLTTLTNTHTPATTSVSATKVWVDADNQDGIRPASVTINLLADGEVYKSKDVSGDDWSVTFGDLPKFKAGKEIVYTVSETAVDGYDTVITGACLDR
jgi:hypothetical protein